MTIVHYVGWFLAIFVLTAHLSDLCTVFGTGSSLPWDKRRCGDILSALAVMFILWDLGLL